MSLSDCPECWETPCICGHKYQTWSEDKLRKHISMLQRVLGEMTLQEKKIEPERQRTP